MLTQELLKQYLKLRPEVVYKMRKYFKRFYFPSALVDIPNTLHIYHYATYVASLAFHLSIVAAFRADY